MANTIIIKYSDTAGHTPTLTAGEIAINRADKILFYKDSSNVLKSMPLSLNTDGTFAANSDTEIPSQKAARTYADSTAFVNALIFG